MIRELIKGLNSPLLEKEFDQMQSKRCPNCPGQMKRNLRPQMDLIEKNYSGCGIDIYQCPECNKIFQINYCVESITEWD